MSATTYRVPTILGFVLVRTEGSARTAARQAKLNGFRVEAGVEVREATEWELEAAAESCCEVIDCVEPPYVPQKPDWIDEEDAIADRRPTEDEAEV